MADVALTWGLGLLGSYIVYINTKNIKRTIATSIVGIVLLAVTLFIISPVISQLIPSIIQGIDYTKAYSQTQASINEPIIILTQILFVIGGFMLSFTLTLIYYAGFTLANLISVFTEGGIPLEPTTTAIIPGVSIPFIEGVLALIIVLFVHEVSHGLLARVAKVKLKSVGVVLLGILPVGAFVEPDDKELNTKKTIDRVRVYIAGVGANFITMMLFFIIFLAIQPIIISSSQTVYVYAGNMENYTGQEVISLNNITIESIDFENLPYTSGDTVLIKTTETEFEAIVPESGKVGIMGNGKINDPLVLMLFNTIALILALNYFVAIFNLIPISILDGYYILESVISKNKIKWISYALIASMISMFLPWLFK